LDASEQTPEARERSQGEEQGATLATERVASREASSLVVLSDDDDGDGDDGQEVATANLPLAGMRVCFTGRLGSLTRDEAVVLVQQFGGTPSPSVGVTLDLLVCGAELEDGRAVEEGSKYAKALQAQKDQLAKIEEFEARPKKSRRKRPRGPLRILDEESFLALLPERGAPELLKLRAGLAGANADRRKVLDVAKAMESRKLPAAEDAASSTAKPKPPKSSGEPALMWVDKYAPTNADEIVGNNAAFSKLLYWLRHWDTLCPKPGPAKRRRNADRPPKPPLPADGKPSGLNPSRDNIYARAALLSGPPGIGKSTSAALVAKLCGRVVVEFNASDKRNAKTLEESLRPIVSGIRVLSWGAASSSSSSSQPEPKRVVIMDEVDGLAGNDDRGGTKELISIIATTRCPIICICNDRQSPKVRSLSNHCLDLRYQRPRKEAIAHRMAEIAKKEGISVQPAAVQVLADAMGGDVRQVLHSLESWARRARGKTLDAVGIKAELTGTDKDAILRHTGFSASTDMLRVSSHDSAMAPKDRIRYLTELFFVDYDLIPLMLQQLYLTQIAMQRDLSPTTQVLQCAYASQAFSDADVLSNRLRSQNQWGLLPAVAALNVRAVASARSLHQPAMGFPEFFSRTSTWTRRRRLVAELATHMSAQVCGLPGRSGLVLDHLSVLRERLFAPLFEASALSKGGGNAEAAAKLVDLAGWESAMARRKSDDDDDNDDDDEVVEVSTADVTEQLVRSSVGTLVEYGLSKDDAMETLCEVRLDNVRDPKTEVAAPIRDRFSKLYSSVPVKSQALVDEQGVSAKGRKKRLARTTFEDDEEGEGTPAVEEGEDDNEDDVDVDAFRVKRAKRAAGADKKHATSAGKKRATSSKKKLSAKP
jgi:replication factor C subunit 1